MNIAGQHRYRIKLSNRYKKDFQKLVKAHADVSRLETVIDLLLTGHALPEQYQDHELHGKFAGVRECHVAPDWLLMYIKDREHLVILLLRTGTHRDTLGIE